LSRLVAGSTSGGFSRTCDFQSHKNPPAFSRWSFSVVVAGGDFSNGNIVQAISNPICRVCIGANNSLVSTLTPLPEDRDDAVGGAVGNVFYILGGNSMGNNHPAVLIGTP